MGEIKGLFRFFLDGSAYSDFVQYDDPHGVGLSQEREGARSNTTRSELLQRFSWRQRADHLITKCTGCATRSTFETRRHEIGVKPTDMGFLSSPNREAYDVLFEHGGA